MTIYTPMPMELVLDGWRNEPGPFVEVTIHGAFMQLSPTDAPGIGRIVRLLSAPLDYYLRSEYAPGQLVSYQPAAEPPEGSDLPDFA